MHHVHLLALVLRDGERDVRAVGAKTQSACGAGVSVSRRKDAPDASRPRSAGRGLAHEHPRGSRAGRANEVPARPRAVPTRSAPLKPRVCPPRRRARGRRGRWSTTGRRASRVDEARDRRRRRRADDVRRGRAGRFPDSARTPACLFPVRARSAFPTTRSASARRLACTRVARRARACLTARGERECVSQVLGLSWCRRRPTCRSRIDFLTDECARETAFAFSNTSIGEALVSPLRYLQGAVA